MSSQCHLKLNDLFRVGMKGIITSIPEDKKSVYKDWGFSVGDEIEIIFDEGYYVKRCIKDNPENWMPFSINNILITKL